mgnify:CR=1 FL=1
MQGSLANFAAGVLIIIFRPFKIGKIDRYHLRNHRRAIMIDGRIGVYFEAAAAETMQSLPL